MFGRDEPIVHNKQQTTNNTQHTTHNAATAHSLSTHSVHPNSVQFKISLEFETYFLSQIPLEFAIFQLVKIQFAFFCLKFHLLTR